MLNHLVVHFIRSLIVAITDPRKAVADHRKSCEAVAIDHSKSADTEEASRTKFIWIHFGSFDDHIPVMVLSDKPNKNLNKQKST